MKITKTYNPLIRETDYHSSFFVKIPVPSDGEVIVLSGGTGLLAIDNGNYQSFSTRQIRNGQFNRQAIIDVMPHNIEISFESFSADQVHKFIFTVSALCTVDNPIAIYKSKIKDMCSYAFSDIESTIRDIASAFDPNELSDLIIALDVKSSLLNTKVVGADVSNIKISVNVDELYRGHLKKKTELKQQTELTEAEIQAAKKLSESEISDTTAILSEVAKGNITLEQAIGRMKAVRKSDFNDQLEQFTKLSNLYSELVHDGTLTEQQAAEIIKKQLPRISTNSTNSTGAEESLLLGESSKNEDNPYQVIDD